MLEEVRSNAMIPRPLRVCLLVAMPALLSAQETKLVNCRTLEAAGNFVGPDEVIDGNMVCQKLKPGATAPAKTQPAKADPAKPQPEAAIVPEQPMSVAEAARANRQRLAAKQNAAAAPVAAPVPASPNPVPEPIATAPPARSAQPVTTAPAKPQPSEPVAPSEPAAVPSAIPEAAHAIAPTAAQPAPVQPVTAAASTPPALRARVKRDAPVAAGTPSEPPEKDYGFSDANAVETPAATPRAEAESDSKVSSAHAQVQIGAFDKPSAMSADGSSQAQNASAAANLQEGQRADCTKNITLASMKDEKFAPGAPSWAQGWIAKNQKAIANVCFSAAPMRGAKNYLVVFYMMPSNSNAAMPMPDSAAGAFTARDGTWHYTGDAANAPGAAQDSEQGQVWYATAYSEEGAAVAEQWPEQAKRGDNERVSEQLLVEIVAELLKH
jgi:hypothetical protein